VKKQGGIQFRLYAAFFKINGMFGHFAQKDGFDFERESNDIGKVECHNKNDTKHLG